MQQYEIKKYHFSLKFKPGEQVIGSIEVFFNIKSQFLFQSCQGADAFIIRTQNWHRIKNIWKEQKKTDRILDQYM